MNPQDIARLRSTPFRWPVVDRRTEPRPGEPDRRSAPRIDPRNRPRLADASEPIDLAQTRDPSPFIRYAIRTTARDLSARYPGDPHIEAMADLERRSERTENKARRLARLSAIDAEIASIDADLNRWAAQRGSAIMTDYLRSKRARLSAFHKALTALYRYPHHPLPRDPTTRGR